MNNQFNLGTLQPEGCQKSPKDVRDIQLTKIQPPVPIPDEFVPHYLDKIPVLFQNGLGVCSAHAGAHFKQIQEYLETVEIEKYSPRYLWIETKKIDGVPLEAGSYLRAIFKTLQNKGICDYDLLVNDFSSLQDFSDPALITAKMDNNAQPRIIKHYAFLNDLSFGGLKQAIYQDKAVLMRILVDEGFFRTKSPTFATGKWGHLVVGCGYDLDGIYIIDSTEENPKLAIKKIRKEYVRFITEAGTALDAGTEMIRKMVKKKELLQKLVVLYQKVIELWKQFTKK